MFSSSLLLAAVRFSMPPTLPQPAGPYAGTWTLTLLPTAPDNNTYLVVNSLRPAPAPDGSNCWGALSSSECTGGDGVDEFAYVRQTPMFCLISEA